MTREQAIDEAVRRHRDLVTTGGLRHVLECEKCWSLALTFIHTNFAEIVEERA